MFVTWNAVLVQQERYNDQILAVQRQRLVRQARAHRPRQHQLQRYVLDWIGRRLTVLGNHWGTDRGGTPIISHNRPADL